MSKSVVIAVDAMGGDNSPAKIIKGISFYSKKTVPPKSMSYEEQK